MKSGVSNPFSKAKKAVKTLEGINLKRSADGGFQAHHQFAGYDHEPETHSFKPTEGKKMLAHVGKMMGVEAESD